MSVHTDQTHIPRQVIRTTKANGVVKCRVTPMPERPRTVDTSGASDPLRRLTTEELAQVKPLTDEQVDRAFDAGRAERERAMAALGITAMPLPPKTDESED